MNLLDIFRILSVSFLSIAILLNTVILYYFLPTSRKARFNGYFYFITNMAVADILTCLTRIACLSSFMTNDVRISEIACRWSEIPFAFCDVSLLMLLGMSFDRFRKITKPLGKQINRKIGASLSVFSYCLAFSAHLQFLLVEAYVFVPETRICSENISRVKNAMFTIFVVLVFAVSAPMVLIVWFNFSTLRSLKNIKLFDRDSHNTVANDRMTRLEYTRNLKASKTLRMLMILAIVTNFIPRAVLTTSFIVFTMTSIPMLKNLEWLPVFFQTFCDMVFASCAIHFFVYLKFVKGFRAFILSRGRDGRNQPRSSSINRD